MQGSGALPLLGAAKWQGMRGAVSNGFHMLGVGSELMTTEKMDDVILILESTTLDPFLTPLLVSMFFSHANDVLMFRHIWDVDSRRLSFSLGSVVFMLGERVHLCTTVFHFRKALVLFDASLAIKRNNQCWFCPFL